MTRSRRQSAKQVKSRAQQTLMPGFEQKALKVLHILVKRELEKYPVFYPDPDNKKHRTTCLAKVERDLFYGKFKCPWSFIQAINDVFEKLKARVTNKRKKAFTWAKELQDTFFNLMDVLMEDIGYCCGHWYTLNYRTVVCDAKVGCVIKGNTKYYRYEAWTYCLECFNKTTDPTIELAEDVIIPKTKFHEFKCMEGSKKEHFVRCALCTRRFHVICVRHIRYSGYYICQQCRERDPSIPPPLQLRASDLPVTECDEHITKFINKTGFGDDAVTIRVLARNQSVVNVKTSIKEYRQGATEYNYENLTIFAFYDTGDGEDACFFSAIIQLYDETCPAPNNNSAYVSYIDSVNLVPIKNRTLFYHYFLLGLFDYIREIGYKDVVLWSCPPKKNQDYIFNVKPASMKMPTKVRLSNWYGDFLELGVREKVIEKYRGIDEYSKLKKWINLDQVPYIEGDLWIVRMSEAVQEAHKEHAKLKEKAAKRKTKDAEKDLLNFDISAHIWKLMKVQITGFNKEYFFIHLRPPAGTLNKDKTYEKMIDVKWIESRHEFVDFFFENLYEFSSARHAVYSTFQMLYRIVMEGCFCLGCRKQVTEGLSFQLICKTCHGDTAEDSSEEEEFSGIKLVSQLKGKEQKGEFNDSGYDTLNHELSNNSQTASPSPSPPQPSSSSLIRMPLPSQPSSSISMPPPARLRSLSSSKLLVEIKTPTRIKRSVSCVAIDTDSSSDVDDSETHLVTHTFSGMSMDEMSLDEMPSDNKELCISLVRLTDDQVHPSISIPSSDSSQHNTQSSGFSFASTNSSQHNTRARSRERKKYPQPTVEAEITLLSSDEEMNEPLKRNFRKASQILRSSSKKRSRSQRSK